MFVIPAEAITFIPGAIKFDIGIAVALAPVENTLGYIALGTTATSDLLKGYTYRAGNGDLNLGLGTGVALATAAAGTTPESNVDGIASVYQFGFDISGTGGSININSAFNAVYHLLPWE